MRIVVAVAHGRPRNYANLSTIKVSNSSFLAYGFSVWFVNRQEIQRLELVYLESFLFELLETEIKCLSFFFLGAINILLAWRHGKMKLFIRK